MEIVNEERRFLTLSPAAAAITKYIAEHSDLKRLPWSFVVEIVEQEHTSVRFASPGDAGYLEELWVTASSDAMGRWRMSFSINRVR